MQFAKLQRREWILLAGGVLALGLIYLVTRPAPLEDPDPNLARIDRLERKKDLDGLRAATKDANAVVACRAVVALARVGGGKAKADLAALAADGRQEVQRTALLQLGRLGRDGDIAAIASAFSSSNPDVRTAAAQALGNARLWDGVDPLVKALEDQDVRVRTSAILALEQIIGLQMSYYKAEAPAPTRAAAIARMKKDLPRFKPVVESHSQQRKE